jgi:hypothetical protein
MPVLGRHPLGVETRAPSSTGHSLAPPRQLTIRLIPRHAPSTLAHHTPFAEPTRCISAIFLNTKTTYIT